MKEEKPLCYKETLEILKHDYSVVLDAEIVSIPEKKNLDYQI